MAHLRQPLPLTTLDIPAVYATKPPTTADAFGTQIQYVSEKNGSSSNDGLSWGSPKKEIQDALAQLPTGGIVYVAPGSYRPTTTLQLQGHSIIGQAFGAGSFSATTTIQHNFNGDLISFTQGGRLENIFLSQNGSTAFTGAAIKIVSTGSPRTGTIYLDRVTCSGGAGFERDLDVDGSADSTPGGPGARQIFVSNCMFFGCFTAGETVRLNRVVHCYFSDCEIIQAPAAATQGLKVLDTITEALTWNGGYILGNLSSSAAGTGAIFRLHVTGNVTFESGSNNNLFDGIIGGTYTNLGSAGNSRRVSSHIVQTQIVLYAEPRTANAISIPTTQTVYDVPGAAFSASTAQLLSGLNATVKAAYWNLIWTPGATGNGGRLCSADAGPTNITQLAEFTGFATATPRNDTVNVTTAIKNIVDSVTALDVPTGSANKTLLHQFKSAGAVSPIIYSSKIDILWEV